MSGINSAAAFLAIADRRYIEGKVMKKATALQDIILMVCTCRFSSCYRNLILLSPFTRRYGLVHCPGQLISPAKSCALWPKLFGRALQAKKVPS